MVKNFWNKSIVQWTRIKPLAKSAKLHKKTACIALLSLVGLAGCGGGNTPTAAQVSGRIADGYIRGATVFWDCNGNMALDPGEPHTTSIAGGVYTLPSSPPAKAPLLTCSLRAIVPATAIDEDTGTAVGSPYMMAAMDGAPEFISPLTTLQNLGVYSEEELRSKFPANANLPLTTDYIAAGESGKQAHNAAKFVALSLQSVNGLISTDDADVRRDVLGRAVAFIPASAYTSLNASPATLTAFVANTPKIDLSISAASATLDKAQFILVESAFSGPDDPRRPFVQSALDTINRNPHAVVGNSVYWQLIDPSERSTWGSNIVGGNNGFIDSELAESFRSSLFAELEVARVNIYEEQNKQIKKMAAVVAKNAAQMTLTSIDSAVKLTPANNVVVSLRLVSLNKVQIKNKLTKAQSLLNKNNAFLQLTTGCGGLATDLAVLDDGQRNFVDASKLADITTSMGKCVAGLTGSERMTAIFEGMSTGKAYGEGYADGDLWAMVKALSDLVAVSLDILGGSVASALYNQTLGMYIAMMHSVNELNIKGDEASAVFEENTKLIIENFNLLKDSIGSALISARLAPYIRPKYLFNITVPNSATVGQPVAVLIDQGLAQPIAYRVTWGTYPNGNAVTASPSAWSSSGGNTTLSATYAMPGRYPVVIELYDNSLGVALVAFQVLGKEVVVSCPSGTTVDTEGDCVANVANPSISINFDPGSQALLGAENYQAVEFVTGKNGRYAAKFGGVGNPGYIRIPNQKAMQFVDGATFDLYARMDSMIGMDGYGDTVTNGAYAMTLLAKSHDRAGISFMANSMTDPDTKFWSASFDPSMSGACEHLPHDPVPLGTWVRVTYTMSLSNGIRGYLDKKLIWQCPDARPDFSTMNEQDLYIGKFSDEWYPLNGAIQDIRVYKRALTATEVQTLQ